MTLQVFYILCLEYSSAHKIWVLSFFFLKLNDKALCCWMSLFIFLKYSEVWHVFETTLAKYIQQYIQVQQLHTQKLLILSLHSQIVQWNECWGETLRIWGLTGMHVFLGRESQPAREAKLRRCWWLWKRGWQHDKPDSCHGHRRNIGPSARPAQQYYTLLIGTKLSCLFLDPQPMSTSKYLHMHAL